MATAALPIDADPFARNPQGEIEIDGVIHEGVRSHWFPWTMPFNLTGHPAVSLPCGVTSEGLPCGLQLVGRHGATSSLLNVALSCEPFVSVF